MEDFYNNILRDKEDVETVIDYLTKEFACAKKIISDNLSMTSIDNLSLFRQNILQSAINDLPNLAGLYVSAVHLKEILTEILVFQNGDENTQVEGIKKYLRLKSTADYTVVMERSEQIPTTKSTKKL